MSKTIITDDQQNHLADVLEDSPEWMRDAVTANLQSNCSMYLCGAITMNLINNNEQRPA